MKKKKQGFSKVILLVIVGTLFVAGGGYFFLSKSGGLPAGLAPLNPVCEFNDPDLCKFVNNFSNIKNYSIQTTFFLAGGKEEGKSIFEAQGEDRSHIVNFLSGRGETSNWIIIGDTTYIKTYLDNSWEKYSQPLGEVEKDVKNYRSDFGGEKTTKDTTTYKKIGKELCESHQCFKYQLIDPSATDTTDYIWFDDREYRLRKTRTESSDGSVSDSIFSYEKISIVEPSPVRDVNPSLYGGESQQSVDQIQQQYGGYDSSQNVSSE